MNELRMLVISPPCIEEVNRAVYRVLAQRHGVQVHLVVPTKVRVEGRWKECLPTDGEPFPTTKLEPLGEHPRLRRLKGLEALIRDWRPTHIIMDADPAQVMTRQVCRASKGMTKPRPRVWVMTADNMRASLIQDIQTALKSRRPVQLAGAWLTWWLRLGVSKRVDHVFTLSDDGTRAMEFMGFRGRVTKIPLGFDPALFHPQSVEQVAATRNRLGLRHRTIAYFGRLLPQKGLHLLLEALALLKDQPWQLLVDRFTDFGGPYPAQLRAQIASLGLADRVVYFNATHAEMPEYVNAADFVVLASTSLPRWKEQYGRVLVEAMACGKIVVGSDSGAIPEVIGGCGRLFPEGDVRALSAVLRQLLSTSDEELAPLREQARNRAHSHLTIFNQAATWADLARRSNAQAP